VGLLGDDPFDDTFSLLIELTLLTSVRDGWTESKDRLCLSTHGVAMKTKSTTTVDRWRHAVA